MSAKHPQHKPPKNSFSEFLSEPVISMAILVFALIAFLLSIIDYGRAVAGF